MKPLALEIEGLTSFRQKQEVDLTDLDLFVITGPTGAGKTSILDAMTFALYGKVCRVKSGEPREMITHNAPVVKVRLDFAIRATTYRIERRMTRKGSAQARLARLEDDDVVEEFELPGVKAVNRRVEELLGLDFQAFTKAVLLPQGRFHEFLSGDADARRTILSRLLDLERFAEMGARARQKARELGITLEERDRRLEEDYADATSGHLEGVRQCALKAESRVAELSEAAKLGTSLELEIRSKSTILEGIAAHLEPLREIEGQLQALAVAIPGLEAREKKAADAVEAARQALEHDDQKRAEARLALEQAATSFGDEGAVLVLLAAGRVVRSEAEKLVEAEAAVIRIAAERTLADQELESAKRKAEAADMAVAAAVENGERLREGHVLADRVLKCVSVRSKSCEAAVRLAEANKDLATAEKARAKAAQTLEHLRTKHTAADLKSSLQIGHPCPVCQQVVATLTETAVDLSDALEAARGVCVEAEKRHQEAQILASTWHIQHSSALREYAELSGSLPAGAGEVEPAAAEAQLVAAVAALGQAREEYKSLTETQRVARGKLHEAMKTAGGAAERVGGCERERNDLLTRIQEARSTLESVFGPPVPQDVQAQLETSLSQLRDCRDVLKKSGDACDTARSAYDAARAAQDHVVAQRHEQVGVLAQARGRATEARRSLVLVAQISDQAAPLVSESEGPFGAQLTGLRSYVHSVTEAGEEARLHTSEHIVEALRELAKIGKVANLETDSLSPSLIAESLTALARSAEADLAELRRAVDDVAKRIGKRAEIEASMLADRKSKELHQRLGLELQAGRFLDYVLSESMRSLAVLATAELLKITGGRYSMQPKDTNFEVIDHENADERRSVSTLSGGETFLASLALALALSGSVRDLAGNAAAGRVESMFIDEGFGALDAETLDTAVDALERLVQEHRMIGVISHVPALADRIQSGLEVRKVGASSTIFRRDHA